MNAVAKKDRDPLPPEVEAPRQLTYALLKQVEKAKADLHAAQERYDRVRETYVAQRAAFRAALDAHRGLPTAGAGE